MEAIVEHLHRHEFVPYRVKPLGQMELAIEPRHCVFVEADEVARTSGQAGLGLAEQLLDRRARGMTHPVTQRRATHHPATAGQNRQPHVLQRREVEDALDSQHRLEEQRQD